MPDTPTPPPILSERRGPVGVVWLNRPEKHNAINRALSAALARVIAKLEADEAVRAIVLTGAGERAFCAGADMGERVAQMEDDRNQEAGIRKQGEESGEAPSTPTAPVVLRGPQDERLAAQDERLRGQPGDTSDQRPATTDQPPADGYGAVARATKPVIAAVNGLCYGGGTVLATSTDIRLASPNATFRFVGASYGLVVAGAQLPRIVGPAYAKELLFTARVIDADEAERIGLVNRVVREGSVLDAAVRLGEEIAANSPGAVTWAKVVVDAATEVDQGRGAEAEASRTLRATADHAERFRDAAGRVTGGR